MKEYWTQKKLQTKRKILSSGVITGSQFANEKKEKESVGLPDEVKTVNMHIAQK